MVTIGSTVELGKYIKVTGPHFRDGKVYANVKVSPWLFRWGKLIGFFALAAARLRLVKEQVAYDWAVDRVKRLIETA